MFNFLQVQLEHDDNGYPIQVDLHHSVAKCESNKKVLITATVTGNQK